MLDEFLSQRLLFLGYFKGFDRESTVRVRVYVRVCARV